MSLGKYFLKYGHNFFKTQPCCLDSPIEKKTGSPPFKNSGPNPAVLIVQQGNVHHYNYVKQEREKFKQAHIVLADYDLVNLLFYFAERSQQRKVLYCTPLRYDYVEAIPEPRSKQISSGDKYSSFYNQHTFVIRNTFLDVHPFDAYAKLTNLYALPVDLTFAKLFELSFSKSPMTKNVFYSEVQALSRQVLEKGQLKLQHLARKKYKKNMPKSEDIERRKRISQWKLPFQQMLLSPVYQQQQIRQFQWAEQCSLFPKVSLEKYIEEEPRPHSYALFSP